MRLQKIILPILFLLLITSVPTASYGLLVTINGQTVTPEDLSGTYPDSQGVVPNGFLIKCFNCSLGPPRVFFRDVVERGFYELFLSNVLITAIGSSTLTIRFDHTVEPPVEQDFYPFAVHADGVFLPSRPNIGQSIRVEGQAGGDVINAIPPSGLTVGGVFIPDVGPSLPIFTVAAPGLIRFLGEPFQVREGGTPGVDILCPSTPPPPIIEGLIDEIGQQRLDCLLEVRVDVTFTNPTDSLVLAGSIGIVGTRIAGPDGIRFIDTRLAELRVRPFADFNAKLKIDLDRLAGIPYVGLFRANDDEFAVNAFFTLGDGSDGIDPVTEDVSLQIATFSTTIPAGRFRQLPDLNGGWTFDGVINGVNLAATIQPFGPTSYLFKAAGTRADLTGTTNPVTVGLTIGNDGGGTSVEADFD